jgi:hypothetical protein
MHHDHVHDVYDEPVLREVRTTSGDNLTSYAAVKYAFILLTTIAVLYFLAKYIIPILR